MNKLDMAHDYAIKHLENSKGNITVHSLVSFAWSYADAMQAEADKREQKGFPEVLQNDWQLDWSVAPENMIYFAVDSNNDGYFYEYKPYISEGYDYWGDVENKHEGLSAKEYNDHTYQGDWKQSLRERPQ